MIAINFFPSKDNNEEGVMHSRSNNIRTTINDKEDEAKEELFNHFFLHIKLGWRYQRKVVISR